MPNFRVFRNQQSLILRISITIATAIAVGGWAPQSQAQGIKKADIKEDINKEEVNKEEVNKEEIKINLSDLNDVSEWVHLERTGSQVKLIHTVSAPSGVANAFAKLIPVTLGHAWYDHPTSRIVFVPDTCAQPTESNCSITGTTNVTLPTGVNVDQGKFTLEYTESKFLRTVTFRVPTQKS
jgi:hypothetical protein